MPFSAAIGSRASRVSSTSAPEVCGLKNELEMGCLGQGKLAQIAHQPDEVAGLPVQIRHAGHGGSQFSAADNQKLVMNFLARAISATHASRLFRALRYLKIPTA